MDSDGQLTFDDDIVTIRYKQGFQHLLRRDFRKGLEVFGSLKEGKAPANIDEVISLTGFWADRYPESDDDPEALKTLWTGFEQFCSRENLTASEVHDQLKKIVFTRITDLLIRDFQRQDVPNTGLLCELAVYYIELKEYERAGETLVYANRLSYPDAAITALRSDVEFFCGDMKKAKSLLREAFFIDSSRVPMDRLKSGLAREIADLTRREGYTRDSQHWMPVVATYSNIFDTKRELTQEEVQNVEEDCRGLEEEIRAVPRKAQSLKPVLIYKYFILMDHMLISGQVNDPKLAAYETRLRALDEDIYRAYIKQVFYNGEQDG